MFVDVDEMRAGAPPGQTIGEFLGSTAVGGAAAWMTTVAAGSLLGPGGTFVAVIAATAIAADQGGDLGRWIGGTFDK